MSCWQLVNKRDLVLAEPTTEYSKEKFIKIRINKTSIANFDVPIYNGVNKNAKMPIIMGRTGVGFIAEENNPLNLKRGTKVYVSSYSPCGKCYNCREGRTDICQNPIVLGLNANGCMGDFQVVPMQNVYELPLNVEDEECLFIDMLSTALNAIDSLDVKVGEHILIFGASILGNILAQLALYYQLVPIILDSNDDNLNKCKENGVYYTINTNSEDMKTRINNITGGQWAKCSIYVGSEQNNIQNAFDYTNFNGEILITGVDCLPIENDLSTAWEKQLQIKCIKSGYTSTISAINLLANKAVKTSNLIDRHISPELIPDTMFKLSSKVIVLDSSSIIVCDFDKKFNG